MCDIVTFVIQKRIKCMPYRRQFRLAPYLFEGGERKTVICDSWSCTASELILNLGLKLSWGAISKMLTY